MRVEKEFFVDSGFIMMVNEVHRKFMGDGYFVLDEMKFFQKQMNSKQIKITISWDAPEKKIELGEEQFDRCHRMIVGEGKYDHGERSTHIELLKQKLFHGGEK